MKKIITICAAILITASVFAQSPEKMSYQAVVRDGSNALVTSTAVGMQISILQGSASGTAVYLETQTPTSNSNGLVSLEIGDGTVVSGDFSTIDWANGPYFIKTETDPAGGTSYTITGTSQLLSVPYALYAKNTDSWTVNADTIYTDKLVGIGTTTPSITDVLTVDGSIRSYGAIIADFSTGEDAWLSLPQGQPALVLRDTTTAINRRADIRMDNTGNIRFSTGVCCNSTGQGVKLLVGVDGKTTVNDVMNLTPRSTAPTSPSQGDIYFDNTLNKLRVYDGTTWQNCW